MNKSGKNRKGLQNPAFNYKWIIVGISVLTLLVYSSSLQSDFLNWDDEGYIEENQLIRSINIGNLQEMFDLERNLIGNYHPITELSFAVNYALSGLNPKAYILTNVLLHLFNTILVFFFFYRFSKNDVVVASILATLFGIHPMHVESVSWIAERKDVLYVFFYLLAMLSYLNYLLKGNKTAYWWMLVWFLLSLLSKAQAVTLPLVFLLIHVWYEKKSLKTIFLNLAPLFILSILFGVIAIQTQSYARTMTELSFADKMIVGNLGLFIYLFKSVIPHNLSAFHPYPNPLQWPTYYYVLPLFGLLLIIITVWAFKKNRFVFFGLGFFLLTVLPVLQFLPVGMSMHAERYTYLPYLGLFFIIAHFYSQYNQIQFQNKSNPFLFPLLLLYLSILAYSSFKRTKIWNNSETMWADVIDKYPENHIAYVNVSDYCREKGDLKKAVAYADQGILTSGHHIYLYNNKAYALMMAQEFDEALKVLNTATEHVNPDPQLYINKGDCFAGLNKPALANSNYSQALSLNPNHIQALLNKAKIDLNHYKDYDSCIEGINKILALNDQHIEALYILAIGYRESGDYAKALISINQAILLAPEEQILQNFKKELSQQ